MSRSLKFALIGHPVAHSISPQLHHAAYDSLGAAHVYEKRDCPDEAAVRREVEALRSGDLAGINVTVPWKRVALGLADRRHELAAQIGAANVLVREPDGAIHAYNTDALALAGELRVKSAPGAVAIIGSGGAARAAVAASRSLGAERIFLIGRRWTDDVPRDGWANAADFTALGASVMAWPKPGSGSDWDAGVVDADVIVQATSAGMKGADDGQAVSDVVPWKRLRPGVIAYDVVYNPPVTPFLVSARAHVADARGGLGMLVGQAALSIELWLGVPAPREAMADAAERALSLKSPA
jgi:shikimate dehydrogenase